MNKLKDILVAPNKEHLIKLIEYVYDNINTLLNDDSFGINIWPMLDYSTNEITGYNVSVYKYNETGNKLIWDVVFSFEKYAISYRHYREALYRLNDEEQDHLIELCNSIFQTIDEHNNEKFTDFIYDK